MKCHPLRRLSAVALDSSAPLDPVHEKFAVRSVEESPLVNTGRQSAGSRTMARPRTTPEDSVAPGINRPCDLVTVPARQGLEAVDILRLRHSVGPVLHDGSGDTLGFLVPPGTADGWDLPGSACIQTHRQSDHPGEPGDPLGGSGCGIAGSGGAVDVLGTPIAAPPVAGTGWLLPPVGPHARATEPARLRAALREAARTLAAVDRCV